MAPSIQVATVDFHCHLDLCQDMQQAYSACEERRCITLAVTTTPKAFARNRSMADQTVHVHAALGLHPQLVAQRGSEISLFEEMARTTRFIGEIGLDAGRRFYPSFEQQKIVFERALSVCTRLGEKVISLHSVRTAKQVLDGIERTGVHQTCQPVLHWFNASKAETIRAIDLGCLFSVNEQMLHSPKGRTLLELVPMSRLLTETDAPFQSARNRSPLPGEVEGALNIIARAYGLSLDNVALQIRSTAKALVDAGSVSRSDRLSR